MQTMGRYALRYSLAPKHDKRLTKTWQRFADVNAQLAQWVRKYLDVRVVDHDPYAHGDITALRNADIRERGVLKISGINNDHPVWADEENADFRTVHEWCHYHVGSDVSFLGEVAAVRQHQRLLLPYGENMQRACWAEVVGQAAFVLEYGYFPPQKVAFID